MSGWVPNCTGRHPAIVNCPGPNAFGDCACPRPPLPSNRTDAIRRTPPSQRQPTSLQADRGYS